jgi:hypothetical protein
MKANVALLLVAGLGAFGLYMLLKKKDTRNMVMNGEKVKVKDIANEIKQESTDVVPVQDIMPNFGRPIHIQNRVQSPIFENYVDVQKNSYFKPQAGKFY